MLKAQDPVVLLQHGGLDSLTGKTGLAMLRHRQGPIVAVIDPAHVGEAHRRPRRTAARPWAGGDSSPAGGASIPTTACWSRRRREPPPLA